MHPTILKTEQATIDAGAAFAKKLRGGDIVLLHGELGAGKTTFMKGIAKGLGVKEAITSPTFTLMGVYHVPNGILRRSAPQDDTTGAARQLCHIDTYRLKNVDELLAVGAEDYIGEPHTITVIEWPEKIKSMLTGKKTISLSFAHEKDGTRSLVI